MGMRQSDVSNLVIINIDTLRRLEGGLSMPRIDTLDLLSLAYKRDIHQIFLGYKTSPLEYFESCMERVAPIIRRLDYDGINKIYDEIKRDFSMEGYNGFLILDNKIAQFHEYLKSLQNMNNSFKDPSRDDLSKLMSVLNLSIEKINVNNKNIHLDILEIRIFVLMSIIYRMNKEFDSSIVLLEVALNQLNSKHINHSKYLYFYILIVSNLMTTYHRIDHYRKIDTLYLDILDVLEKHLGIKNLSSVFIRIGVNNNKLNKEVTKEYLTIVLDILRNSNYSEIAERYEENFLKLYDFYRN